ncbi:FKBP-type peptidyl-prolyl cis-trans isomerase [Sansalvadorimonas verongulae]|uniref:FKBP-type peptidyl-prolyl cis-trans isomerase n=1 Tax=Sansalvadorimonas verongulae TaxID=2172824 RepID=UPI0012BD3441|nr:peptidylprolyl isomerase [Sansalvadorimonas verongulae]MTI13472.1 peptidylprolyl isomerase [Sansalvadorimonas verongulae]
MTITPNIQAGSKVTLHFSLKLENNDIVDSTFNRTPASFVVGDGNLPEGFEKHIHGLTAGSCDSFLVAPEEAFGQHNPSNIQRVGRSRFAPDMELVEGLVISFADQAGGELPGVIQGFDEQTVTVDFNHPLAGKALIFDVEILSVEAA